MTKWLEEADSLERRCTPDSYLNGEGGALGLAQILYENRRELIDAAKDVAEAQARSYSNLAQCQQSMREAADRWQEIKKLRALLRRVEWQEYGGTLHDWISCPLCGGDKPNHKLDCELAKAVGTNV